MIQPPDILWLGAHKTGTTYLQDLLSQSRAALAEAHLLYIGMQAFRDLYTKPLLYGDHAVTPNVPPLPRFAPETHSIGRYLLFDENILALVQDAPHRTGLYPDGAERAHRVAAALQLEAPDIILGIRSFADYLPSLYCEMLKSMPFRPFRQFHKTPLTALSWCDLITRLQCAFPRSRLRVYRTEDLRGREAELLNWVGHILIPDAAARRADVSARREGFSQEAIEMLHRLHRDTGKVGPQDLARCLRAHPRTEGSTAFSPWSLAEKRDLDLVYKLDLAAIRGLDRVEVWSPPPR